MNPLSHRSPPSFPFKRFINHETEEYYSRSEVKDVKRARLEDIRTLELFFLGVLCEDPVDGTDFDMLVLEKMKELRNFVKFGESSNRDYIYRHKHSSPNNCMRLMFRKKYNKIFGTAYYIQCCDDGSVGRAKIVRKHRSYIGKFKSPEDAKRAFETLELVKEYTFDRVFGE